MHKIITFENNESKDIIVKVNGNEKFQILSKTKTIKAMDIYNLLDYSCGDTFETRIENKNMLESGDLSVIEFFKKLLDDIIEQVNQIDRG